MKEQSNNDQGKINDLAIPLSSARKMICNWQQSSAFEQTGGFKAFLIPAEEINQFMNLYLNQGVGVRAYIGLDNKIKSDTIGGQLKLIFVATKLNSIQSGIGPQLWNDIISDLGNGPIAFDLSTPCPVDCDFLSPLNSPCDVQSSI